MILTVLEIQVNLWLPSTTVHFLHLSAFRGECRSQGNIGSWGSGPSSLTLEPCKQLSLIKSQWGPCHHPNSAQGFSVLTAP